MLPRLCVACGGPSPALCDACRRALRPLPEPLCGCCGAPTAWRVERCRECAGRRLAFSSAAAAVAYEGPARAFVRGWKERGLRHLARPAAELVAAQVACPSADLITWIPPDPIRQLGRSRHPAEGLARELANLWSLGCSPLLGRAQPTQRQASLPLHRRGPNMRGAFLERAPSPARVVLVDDVYTSGSTASAAAAALRSAGAKEVKVVTFARAVR